MEQIQKHALTRASKRLQKAIDNVDRGLLEDLNLDGDSEEVSSKVKARYKALLTSHTILVRELDQSRRTHDLAMDKLLSLEDESRSRALISDCQTHWKISGGEAAEDAVNDLIAQLEVAMKLLSHGETSSAVSTPSLSKVQPKATMEFGYTTPSTNSRSHEDPLTEREHGGEVPNASQNITQGVTGSPKSLDPLGNIHDTTLLQQKLQEQILRLPKFDLPVFTGDIAKFAEFWDVFDSAVHSNRLLPPTVKFHYLRTSLRDDALSMVAGYEITDANYELAINTLRDTYSRPEFVRVQMGERLQKLRPATSSAITQRITLAQVKSIWLQLKKMGESDNNVFVMCLIRDKFPSKTLEYVGHLRADDSTSWGVSQLLDGIDRAIRTFEAVEDSARRRESSSHVLALRSTSRSSSRGSSSSSITRRSVRERRSSQSPSHSRRHESPNTFRCMFCRSTEHPTSRCDRVTSIKVRWRIALQENLCYTCFSPNHRVQDCDKPPCAFCQGGHHKVLCRLRARHSSRRHQSSSSSRSYSRERDNTSRNRSSQERATSYRRYRSPSPGPNPSTRGPFRPSVQFCTSTTKQNVEANPLEAQYVGDEVDTEDEDYSTNSIVQCSEQQHLRILPKDPRLMVVTAPTFNRYTLRDELVVLLLDSGAQHSFIKTDTAQRLGLRLEDPRQLTTKSFGGYTNTEVSFNVQIILRDRVEAEMRLNIRTRRMTTSVRADTHISDEDIELLRHSNSFSQSSTNGEVDIDILIGIDYYWRIVDPRRTQRLPSGLTIAYTRFGPVMSGSGKSRYAHTCSASISTEQCTQRDNSDPDITQLWDLEFLGITDSVNPRQDDQVNEEVVKRFYDTVQVIDGLIHVQFPWKDHHPRLLDNKTVAMRRLEHQYESLHNNSELWQQYCVTFVNQERSGIIEEVAEFDFDGPQVYYMPHQAVLKADSSTTAVRIVFDASSHKKGAPSLNDCLHQGPTLLPDLAGALIRSRLPRFLIISDVEKAFHQIRLQKDQRDATRFLWLKDTACPPTQDNLRIFRFTRVVFGINVSPFLLNMSIKYALERDHSNALCEEVLANTYVDNVLIGANDTEECIRKQQECKQIFHRMGMNLREFMSNNASAMEHIPQHDRMKNVSYGAKLLGLKWDPVKDTLHIKVNMKSHQVDSKRTALQALASNFDPLGYLTPLFVQAKIFIQDLWKDKYSWDAPFEEPYSSRWQEIVNQIDGYTCSVPRFIAYGNESSEHELLLFADASKRMYSAVAYLLSRAPNACTKSHLLMAKARLAPLKEASIPRLELMASDTAVSLAQFLLKEMKIAVKAIRFFSDSHITLYWIHTDRPVKTFVENRVKRIRSAIEDFASKNIEIKFYYVSSQSNPADCATRGLSARDISDHIWWNGPSYVCQCPTTWPHSTMNFAIKPTSDPETDLELKVTSLFSSIEHRSVLPFQRTNDYHTLIRSTAFVLKFLRKRVYDKVSSRSRARLDQILPLREVTITSGIEVTDVSLAEQLLFREHQRESAVPLNSRPFQQLNTYIDPNGIIRVSTRMQNADIIRTAKNPILLAPKHQLTTMIIARYHQHLFHTGVEHVVSLLRQRYFIPRIRRTVRQVLSRCVLCKRHQGRPYRYPSSPDLPLERVTRSRPFQRIGLDYFGPIMVFINSSETRKVWVCLFACMTTRALHLELVHNNSTVEFLLAFRRFMARRGAPDFIISDNAPTFKLGKDILVNELLQFVDNSAVRKFTTQNALRWKFITPLSPWEGGFYERLIGMVKRSLKKTIHRNTLDIRSFETLLIEIEAILNARPLTTVNMEATGEILALRPVDLISPYYHLGHFSSPCGPCAKDFQYYVPSDSETRQSLKVHYERLLTTLDYFWSLWHKDYLHMLAERAKGRSHLAQGASSWPSVGEVVIISQESVPRTVWPLGIITRLNTSKDGAFRSVQVKTGKNSFTDRSINQLIPLELHAHSFDDAAEGAHQRRPKMKSASPTRIQPPRQVKRSFSR